MAVAVCIGILDSGLGGLSVLREIHFLMPEYDFIYVADSAWCPYGPKPADAIKERVFQISEFLIQQGAECLVVACNSATISAIKDLREEFSVPFVGMEPGVKPAVEATRCGTIGVLATEASLAGEKFRALVHQYASDTEVVTKPCPAFVDLVEVGDIDSFHTKKVVDAEIRPLLEAGSDTIVLGCTHYPFLEPLIKKACPKSTSIIHTGKAVARRVRDVCSELPSFNLEQENKGSIFFHSTAKSGPPVDIIQKLVPELKMSYHSLWENKEKA